MLGDEEGDGVSDLSEAAAAGEEKVSVSLLILQRLDRIESRIDHLAEKIENVHAELDRKIGRVRTWSISILAIAVTGLIVTLFLPTL